MVSLPPRATITSRLAVPVIVFALALPTMVAFSPAQVTAAWADGTAARGAARTAVARTVVTRRMWTPKS